MKRRISIVCSLLVTGPAAHADVSFNFDYTGSVEFNDPGSGAARRAALEDAADRLGRIFDHDAVIEITVSSSNDISSGFLAAAASSYTDPPFGFSGYDRGVVMHKILTGTDKNGSAADGEVEVNFGFDWDLDDDVSPELFDFKATIIHEIVHTLGFGSGVFEDGSDVFGTPAGSPGVWEVFDDHLSDKNGVPLIDDSSFAINGTLWSSLGVGGPSPAGGLFFNGPNAMAANAGQPVGLYSPSPWEDGSSGSHLDDENPAQAGLLMLAATDTGRYRRNLGDIERGILLDLGYQLHLLPEPAIEIQSVTLGVSAVLKLTGPEDRWYAVECIDDPGGTSGWDEVEVVELAGGSATVTVPLMATDSRKFFRLRETGVPAPVSLLRSSPDRARR